jgi:hypothetical protein
MMIDPRKYPAVELKLTPAMAKDAGASGNLGGPT